MRRAGQDRLLPRLFISIIHNACIRSDEDERDEIAGRPISGEDGRKTLIRSACAQAVHGGVGALLAARHNFRQYPPVTVFITHVKYEPLPVDPRQPAYPLALALQWLRF